ATLGGCWTGFGHARQLPPGLRRSVLGRIVERDRGTLKGNSNMSTGFSYERCHRTPETNRYKARLINQQAEPRFYFAASAATIRSKSSSEPYRKTILPLPFRS